MVRHKARLVADGHLTHEPIKNIYSDNLDIWGADIGNAYLEVSTDEKLYIVDGPEFQELEGYILIFSRHCMD